MSLGSAISEEVAVLQNALLGMVSRRSSMSLWSVIYGRRKCIFPCSGKSKRSYI